jgi:PAS domain S-box-containing protein
MLDVIVKVDLQGNIQYASPSFQTVLGYAPEQLIGKSVFAKIHPDEVDRLRHLFQAGLELQKSGRVEHRAQHANGHYIWLEAVGKMLTAPNGTVEGAIFASRDITERKHAETLLNETELRFHAVISNAPIILFACDKNSNLTLVEGRGLERLGISFETVVGTPADRLYPDEPRVMEMIERALAGEEFSAVVHLATLVFEIICTPQRDANGQVVGMIGVAIDVTERTRAEEASRASERKYATLLELASDAILIADEHGHYIDVNAAACEMLCYTRQDLLHLNVQDVVTSEDLAETPIPWEQMRARTVLMERRLRRKDSSLLTVEVSAKVLDDGRLQIFARDITERKQAEKQRFELALEKERTTLLQRFLGDASHDLRTPLTIMKTSIYLLRRLADQERRGRHLDMLDEQTAHLQRLLEDFLSMARINQAEAEEFKFVSLNLDAVIRTVMESQMTLADQKNHVLEFIPETDIPPVTADEAHLHRAIAHLVLNALNYTPDGGRITIRTYFDTSWAVVEVNDSGIGINPTDLLHIFEPFFRVDKARAAETGGTGLGLVMVKKIVDAHGGKVTVDSTPGRGSTFRVWLPVAVEDEHSLARK